MEKVHAYELELARELEKRISEIEVQQHMHRWWIGRQPLTSGRSSVWCVCRAYGFMGRGAMRERRPWWHLMWKACTRAIWPSFWIRQVPCTNTRPRRKEWPAELDTTAPSRSIAILVIGFSGSFGLAEVLHLVACAERGANAWKRERRRKRKGGKVDTNGLQLESSRASNETSKFRCRDSLERKEGRFVEKTRSQKKETEETNLKPFRHVTAYARFAFPSSCCSKLPGAFRRSLIGRQLCRGCTQTAPTAPVSASLVHPVSDYFAA
eukprot:scaffold1435_cov267-Pinguiococcus_pyrenoidosus.AAC.34